MRIQGTDTIGNPVVLVEVLSESTGDYDHGKKFDLCRSIRTFRDYVLIDQSRIHIEHRRRPASISIRLDGGGRDHRG